MVKNNSIGKITHWYDKISVAVVKLNEVLRVGDKIKIKHGGQEFEETITSMELDHKPIQSGKKGQEIAIKLSQKAGEGLAIFPAE
ncbi:MAG: translation elongation factor-like protein [Candidatus Paceibacterota bacterium]